MLCTKAERDAVVKRIKTKDIKSIYSTLAAIVIVRNNGKLTHELLNTILKEGIDE